jgi:hypothetical protein
MRIVRVGGHELVCCLCAMMNDCPPGAFHSCALAHWRGSLTLSHSHRLHTSMTNVISLSAIVGYCRFVAVASPTGLALLIHPFVLSDIVLFDQARNDSAQLHPHTTVAHTVSSSSMT